MSKWIKFKDRFPNSEKHKEVLTFEIMKNVVTGEDVPIICLEDTSLLHVDEGLRFCVYSDGGGSNLTHWMPVPRFPKDTL